MPQPLSSQNKTIERPEPKRHVWPGRIVLLILLVLIAGGLWQRQALSDWIKLRGYQPPVAISELSRQTTMTAEAQHLFYLNKPLIATKANFSGYCTHQEQTIVLGCYHSGQAGIFILQIDKKSELYGVMQVTAAHEMLHAAYERLPKSEKQDVNKQLESYYRDGLKDKDIKKEIDSYRKTEPGELVNEMHSIFGTEVRNLPAGLEQYYSQYFSNRKAIVQQAESYQDAFRSRSAAVTAYDTQLTKLEGLIKQHETALENQAAQLKAQRAQLEAYRRGNSITAYNNLVPTYNAAVRAYNTLLATTRSEISSYNAIVTKRNALVVEEQDLVKQLTGESLPAAQK